MNLYSFFRKKHRKPFLGAFFAAAFLSAFFAFNGIAEAYNLSDYKGLFTSATTPGKDPVVNPISTITAKKPLIKKTTGTTYVPDMKFQFIGSFPYKTSGPLGQHDKAWYWGLIQNFSNKHAFVLRICDTTDTNEENCLFADVPIESSLSSDRSVFCTVNTYSSCAVPKPGNPPFPKIYHYDAVEKVNIAGNTSTVTYTWEKDLAFTVFNTLFKVDTLSKLKVGGYDTPINIEDEFKIGNPKVYKADLWYCAYNNNDGLPQVDDPNDPNIRQFKNLCGDNNQPYFKIASSETFSMPATPAEADTQITNPDQVDQTDASVVDSNTGSTLPVCVLAHPLTGSGTFMGCIAYVGYGVYQITAWIAGILGKAMDFFLGYSISDESYRASVVVTGWKLVRDISNIFFIIILVWTGFATVFNLSGVSMKKVVPGLIINALLINFSLFGTQVIVDISNITARLFYNTMSVCEGKCEYKAPPNEKEISNPSKEGTGGYKPLSTKIVDSFDPQKIFKPGTLNGKAAGDNADAKDAANGGFNSSGISNNVESAKTLGIYDSDYAIYFLIVSIIAAIIMLGMAKMFFGVMFMFVGRVVGIYMSMIFSPFAVLTRGNMPLVGGIKELSWDNWLKDLTNYALLAPIFVFFLYIIYAFINSDLLSIVNLKEGESFMSTVIAVVVPMIIIYMLIQQGVNIAKKYAGTAGNMIQGFAQKATGFVAGAAVGVASGGAAFVGTRSAGLLKLSEAKRAELNATKAEGGFAGRMASLRLGMNDKAQSGSFDVRKTKAFNAFGTLTGKAGISLNDKVSGAIGLGSDATKGGMKAIEKKEKEEVKKKIESIKTDVKDGAEVSAIWEKKAAKLREAEEKRLLSNEAALMQAHRDDGKSEAEVEAMKTNNTLKDSAADLAKKKIDDDYGKVETNKQLTQALRQEFAQTIADGKTFGQQVAAPVSAIGGAVGVGALPIGVTVGASAPLGILDFDQMRKSDVEQSEAKSYVKKSKEDRQKNKLSKEDSLEKGKKEIEKELESIDNTLKDIFAEEIKKNPAHAGKTPEHFFNNPADAAEAITKARRKMKEEIDLMDVDIEFFKKEYHDAMKSGNATKIATARANMSSKIAEKGMMDEKYYQSNPDTKQKKHADLNKKDDELEKIKEKREKGKEKEGDKK